MLNACLPPRFIVMHYARVPFPTGHACDTRRMQLHTAQLEPFMLDKNVDISSHFEPKMRLSPNLGSSSLKHSMDECEVATSDRWDIILQDFETPQKWHMLAATKIMSLRGKHTAWSHRPVTLQLYTHRHKLYLHAWKSKKIEWSWQVKGNIGGWLILHTPNSPPTIIQSFIYVHILPLLWTYFSSLHWWSIQLCWWHQNVHKQNQSSYSSRVWRSQKAWTLQKQLFFKAFIFFQKVQHENKPNCMAHFKIWKGTHMHVHSFHMERNRAHEVFMRHKRIPHAKVQKMCDGNVFYQWPSSLENSHIMCSSNMHALFLA